MIDDFDDKFLNEKDLKEFNKINKFHNDRKIFENSTKRSIVGKSKNARILENRKCPYYLYK